MEFRILGRLQVVDAGNELTPVRQKQRALLALLLLRAGELVDADDAAEALWEGRPPPAARNAIQGHVAALRKSLGRDRIETRAGGYVFRLAEDELDLHVFERLVTSARGRPAAEQAESLAAALALFRGPPLQDFRYDSFAISEAARIDELRLLALEAKVDAELALGRHEAAVPELERLVVEAPLRERLWSQLMVALYRSGRQADALAAYRRARDTMVDELGLEPGPGLQRLERQILNQDPQLDVRTPGSGARLPSPPTPLLGRASELSHAGALVLDPAIRLVTLTGPGGTGKTRLAIEVARAAAPHFTGGAVFVSLAPVADPELVLPTLGHALGVREGGTTALEEALAGRLAEDPTLVVLDNVEHVAAAAPKLGRLLADAPALTLLTTSREPLRLYGEHLFRVPPLDEAAAAQLFVDRAGAVGSVAPEDVSGTAVAEICRRLDRLPLAIELAAARTELMSAEALLERLDEPLRVLTDGPVDQPERQQTLRRTLAWSYERLPADEQRLFARLSVFAGSWTPDTADEICGDGLDSVRGLSSLVDKSLLQVPVEDEPRQSMLETIREYARELLAASGELGWVRRRHFDHFVTVAEEAEQYLRGTPGTWLDRLEQEHAELRAALDNAAADGDHAREQRLAGALWRFWYLRGHLTEGRSRLERALAETGGTAARAKVLVGAAVMAANTGDAATARARAQEGRALCRSLGDDWGQAYSTFMLANVTAAFTEAVALYEEAIATFRGLGDEHSALLASRHLAMLRSDVGEADAARALHEDNLARARETGNGRIAASSLGALAEDELRAGRHSSALGMLRESLAIHRELGDVLDTAVDLCRFAAGLVAVGCAPTAATLVGAFDALGEGIGDRRSWVAGLNDETLAAARAELEREAFEEAWARGRGMAIEAAVDLALAWPTTAGMPVK